MAQLHNALTQKSQNKRETFIAIVELLRPKQWLKNAFVFAPVLFSGYLLDFSALQQALLAFIYFCLCSSFVYICNDIHDLPQDKLHPIKSQKRSLAAERLSLKMAYVITFLLGIIICTGFFWSLAVMGVLIGYIALNIAYSYCLKDQPVVDIFSIAAGFVLRVHAGALAVGVPVSGWMFITTLSLALYLAAVKRRQELLLQGTECRTVLRYYSISLIERYAAISATGALIFYSMYVMAERPAMVLTIPFVLFGIFRYWYIVEAKELGESPTDTLIADWPLMITIGVWIISCIWIIM